MLRSNMKTINKTKIALTDEIYKILIDNKHLFANKYVRTNEFLEKFARVIADNIKIPRKGE
jgi:hypothetical protein